MSDMDDTPQTAAAPHPGYMVVDTEGTGLFDYKQPADADGQPRMASLTLLYVDADLNLEREYSVYIRPDGWKMTEGATKVNGLTDEFLNEHGIPITEALAEYNSGIDNGRIMVAHNAQHDAKQIRAELRRAGLDDRFEGAPNICTMRNMTDVCKIPPPGRRGGYKWPALSEALLFIGSKNLGDHSAKNDALGALEILRYMKRNGLMPEAKVHYAKQQLGERHPPNETATMPMPEREE
jgi:DNA polymerase III epsilon subunit-like protein